MGKGAAKGKQGATLYWIMVMAKGLAHTVFSDKVKTSLHCAMLLYSSTITFTVTGILVEMVMSQAFNPSNGQCRLCNKEKYFIMFRPEGATLNARSEFYSICRHKAKHLMGGKT